MSVVSQVKSSHEHPVMDIFQQHVAAFATGNIEVVLQDFTDHSIVITPDGVFEGKEQIRRLYQGLLAEFGVINNGDSPGININTIYIRGDMLFITWQAESIWHRFEFGTDTFICQNGKFMRQTISYPAPKPR